MALEGSIKDFSLADIFQLIGIQRKTGVLTLKSKDEEVKVSFLNGMVVNADSRSGRLDDRLGSVLVKTGKIGQDDLKRGLKVQRDTLKKLGHVLVEEGLVRPEDLREALNIQITQIIYRLFRWKDGDYHFEQDVHVDYDKENFTPMSAESILMEGMRMIDEWPIIERKITSFDIVFEKVALGAEATDLVEEGGGEEDSGGKGDDFDMIFGGEKDRGAAAPGPGGKIRLGREENLAYQQVNGKATVQEIVERTMLSEFETCRALFDLTNRNLIAPVAAATASATTAPAVRRRSVDVGGALGRLLYLPLAAGLVVAVLHQSGNRLNFFTPPSFRSPQLEPLKAEVARSRVLRAAEAARIHRLLKGAPAGSIDELVAEGLLRAEEAVDPWGRPLGFAAQGEQVEVTSRLGPADDSETVRELRPLGP